MNIYEWVENGGRVRTANSHEVDIYLSDDEDYPLAGTVKAKPEFECQWDVNGNPWKLPTTHGLALVAIQKVVTYRVLSKQELAEKK